MQQEVEVKKEIDMEGGTTGGGKQLVGTLVTTETVLQQIDLVQDFQNYSASKAFMILKRRSRIEGGFLYWITGSINPMIFLLLGGMVAAVAVIFLMFHGNAPATPGGPPSAGVKIL